ncbi:hypothetical protein FIE12Z_4859 [Fusarium flagelliforme]|uniref:Uncharacterized protein n=2 Tax=Fusarium flagelliforme TaxID=2675880 RepID=A0A395MU09_9HYPO|nr:hypothetical protein FIE12Z_4859 [Fusarium flagelliforme]
MVLQFIWRTGIDVQQQQHHLPAVARQAWQKLDSTTSSKDSFAIPLPANNRKRSGEPPMEALQAKRPDRTETGTALLSKGQLGRIYQQLISNKKLTADALRFVETGTEKRQDKIYQHLAPVPALSQVFSSASVQSSPTTACHSSLCQVSCPTAASCMLNIISTRWSVFFNSASTRDDQQLSASAHKQHAAGSFDSARSVHTTARLLAGAF